jgi:hypothetical protein
MARMSASDIRDDTAPHVANAHAGYFLMRLAQ